MSAERHKRKDAERTPPAPVPAHIEAATPILKLVVLVVGGLCALAIIGGFLGIVWDSRAPTSFSFLGMDMKTGHVSVAFVGLGIVGMAGVLRYVVKNVYKLGKLY